MNARRPAHNDARVRAGVQPGGPRRHPAQPRHDNHGASDGGDRHHHRHLHHLRQPRAVLKQSFRRLSRFFRGRRHRPDGRLRRHVQVVEVAEILVHALIIKIAVFS